MKNFKINKTQILAALALAFSLGMAMPSAVFASGEDAGEPAAQAQDVAQKVTAKDLSDAIATAKADAEYAKYNALYQAVANLPKELTQATTDQLNAVRTAIGNIVTSGANVGDMTAQELVDYVNNNVPNYQTYLNMLEAVAKVQKYVNGDATTDQAITEAAVSSKVPEGEIAGLYNAIDAFNNRVVGSVADNIVKLNTRITNNSSFAEYRASTTLVAAVEAVEALPANASESQVTAAVNALRAALPSTTENLATLTKDQLLTAAKATKDFVKNQAMYDALGFVRTLTAGGQTLTATAIEGVYETEAAQMVAYSKMAAAAEAIDPTVMKGLMAYKLPDTSAGGDMNTPDTGIIGLIESGALDLGMVTLIVSVAVAGLAGVSLIAKLYLKHKF